MASAKECYCCQELEELNQKFDDSGLYFVFSFSHVWLFRIAAISPKVRKRDPVKFDSTHILLILYLWWLNV